MGWKVPGRVGNVLGALLATSLAAAVFWGRFAGLWEWATSDATAERLQWLLFVGAAIAIGSLAITGIAFLSYRTQSWFFGAEPQRAPRHLPPPPPRAPPPVPGVPPDVLAHFMHMAAATEAESLADEGARAAAEGRLVAIEMKLDGEVVWRPGMSEQESSARTRAAVRRMLDRKKKGARDA